MLCGRWWRCWRWRCRQMGRCRRVCTVVAGEALATQGPPGHPPRAPIAFPSQAPVAGLWEGPPDPRSLLVDNFLPQPPGTPCPATALCRPRHFLPGTSRCSFVRLARAICHSLTLIPLFGPGSTFVKSKMNVDHQLTGFLPGLYTAWLLVGRGIRAAKADCRFLFRDTDMRGICRQLTKLACPPAWRQRFPVNISPADIVCISRTVILNMALQES